MTDKIDWTNRPVLPLFKMIGLEIVEAEADRSKLRFNATTAVHNGSGVVQGGIITAVLDASMAFAILPGLQKGENFTSADMNITFLRPVTEGEYYSEGLVIKRGSKAIFGEARLYNPKGQLCASATSTIICWKD
jgi:uncharacterized protein (TIGR00369 family)